MTQLLEKAIKEISELPVSEQDIIATIILDELLDEKQWDTAFDKLSKLAEKVRLHGATDKINPKRKNLCW